MLHNATWTLSNFCRGKSPQPARELISPSLTVLTKLIHSLDDEISIDACWAISYPALDLTPDMRIKQWDTLCCRNRVCGGESPQPDWELISPCLTVLTKLIYSLEYDISIDTCWVISYLSDVPTSNDKIQATIESGVCRHNLQTEVVIASGALPTRLALPADTVKLL
ncbi:hypothetical protein C8R42DRAFT_724274 [Lentinula raphanica]|nr:hypothetical protein C8R42DRAFT_724274 [Lentinula raphanica]